MTNRLAIGTAQFGLPYGIANRTGALSRGEARAVLNVATGAGVDTIDTAVAYGSSESVLGELGVGGWRVVSKLPAIPDGEVTVSKWVNDAVAGSLGRLRVHSLYGLLLHRPADLLGPRGGELVDALQALKHSGLVKKIGVSVYDPDEIAAVIERCPIDLIQAPFNVVDRRLSTSGWLSRLDAKQIEIHSRSAFLQGVLLMPAAERATRFGRWHSVWKAWDQWLADSRQTALQACVGFVLAHDAINRVVVGVDRAQQLSEILAAARPAATPLPDDISSCDPQLINPSMWSVQ